MVPRRVWKLLFNRSAGVPPAAATSPLKCLGYLFAPLRTLPLRPGRPRSGSAGRPARFAFPQGLLAALHFPTQEFLGGPALGLG